MTNTKKRHNGIRNRLQRMLCSLLAVLMILGCAVYVAPIAGAADYTIDTTKHKPVNKNAETVYYWHEGLPPADAVDGTKYPVLITWMDKYYLSADDSFGTLISNRKETRIANYIKGEKRDSGIRVLASSVGTVGEYTNLGLSDKLISGWQFKSNASMPLIYAEDATGKEFDLRDYIATYKTDSYNFENVIPYARLTARYNLGSNSMLGNNAVYKEYLTIKNQTGSFVDDLLKNGFAITEEIPNLPYLVCAETAPKINTSSSNVASTELNRTTQSRWGIWIPKVSDTGLFNRENNWLVAMQHYDLEVVAWRDTSGGYAQGTSWRDDVLYDFYLDVLQNDDYLPAPAGVAPVSTGHSPKEYVKPDSKIAAKNFSTSLAHGGDITLDKRTWIFDRQSDGTYTIGTWCGFNVFIDRDFEKLGGYAAGFSNITNFYAYATLSQFDGMGAAQHLGLFYDGSTLVSRACDWSWGMSVSDMLSTGKGNKFRIFWGEPITLNYYRDSFNVEDGQVVNIDGPACIDDGVVYRVGNGGVLVLTDWVVNNGAILVDKGGTLIVQENTDAYGHTRSGLLMSMASGGDGGRLACEGTIINMPGCKVFGGGKYGIQLADGAYVVNYGLIGSENFTCFHDYTIENRGTESSVFAGYGVLGCGISLTNYKVTGSSYPNQGNRETTFSVKMARNAVYGPGKDRLYKHSSVSTSDINQAPKSGSVMKDVKYLEMEYKFTSKKFYQLIMTGPEYLRLAEIFVTDPDGYLFTITKELSDYYEIRVGSVLYKYNNNELYLNTSEYRYGEYVPVVYTISAGENVLIYRDGYSPMYDHMGGYRQGTLIYNGSFGGWKPPAGDTVYYETHY